MTTTRKVFALSLAAAFLSASFALPAAAATNSHSGSAASAQHHAVKPTHSARRSSSRSAASADNSADALNAQSLARSRGQQ